MGETNTDDTKRLREQAMRRQAALRAAMQAEQRAEIPGAFQRRFGGTGQPLAPSQAGAGLPLSGPETTRQRLDRLAALAPSADSTLPAGATPERIQEAARAALAAGDTAAARGLSLMAAAAPDNPAPRPQAAGTAPGGQSGAAGGPPIEVHLPNGTVLEFPSETPQDVINQATQRLILEREAQEPGWSGFNAQGLEAMRRRAGGEPPAPQGQGRQGSPSFLVPGGAVPAGVDANAVGAPPPNAGALAALLTREGQAARRAGQGAAPSTAENDTARLLAEAQRRQAAARASLGRADLRSEIAGNSVREASIWERAGLTPSQMRTAFQENLWGDGDPTTNNFGETLGAVLNNAGEALTWGTIRDEAAGWFDANVLRRGQGTAEERTQFYRDQEARLWDQHPGVALASEIGGGLLSPGAPARWINQGVGLLSRVGRGAAVGAGSGAVFGAMEAENDLLPMQEGRVGGVEDRVAGGLLGLGVGGVGGAALTGIGQGFIRAAQALRGTPGGEEAAATVAGLKDASQGLYRAADEAGVVIPGPRLAQLATDATDALRSAGYNVRLHPRLRAVLSELRDVAKGDQTLSRLEIARRVAGNAGASLQPDERRLASIVIDKIDEMIEELGEGSAALREAREIWARGSRLGRVEQIMENAANAGEGSSYETALASGFRSFLRNPRNLRGFTGAEKRLMQQIARGSAGVRALRGLADLLAPNSLTGAGAVAGALFSPNPFTAVLPPIASYAGRAGSNAIVRGQANALQRMAGQSDAQRVATDAALRQPNALAPFGIGAAPPGLLSFWSAQ